MKGRSQRRFRRFSPGKVPSLAISSCMCYMSMDRQTESFVCLGLIVILLQNTGRSQAECSKRYTDAPGQIIDTLQDNHVSTHTTACRYRICAPPDHYIVLNITQLDGTPVPSGHNCLPRVVVKNVGLGNASPLATLCIRERPLPRVVRSRDNELRIVFRSQVWQSSHLRATFTFHKKFESSPCVACPLVQELNKSMNTSFTLLPKHSPPNSHIDEPNGAGGNTGGGAWHMEYFVLLVLAPLTVVCLCCVIMFYHRRSSRLASHSPSLPTSSYSITPDPPQVPVNQSPLISSQRFSAQHQQEQLRKQREMVCPPRSESTEKFPTSVCLLDEDEPPHMRDNVRIHREVMLENGIRAPPNRTVYDSERQDLMRVCSHKSDLQRHSVRRSPSTASSKRGCIAGGSHKQGATTLQGGGELIDSETRSPLNLVDSDSEGPPPYASLVQINNNSINVCEESTVSTSNSTDGLLQSQQPPPHPCSPNQALSNGRNHAGSRGTSRGSAVRLKHDSADCV